MANLESKILPLSFQLNPLTVTGKFRVFMYFSKDSSTSFIRFFFLKESDLDFLEESESN